MRSPGLAALAVALAIGCGRPVRAELLLLEAAAPERIRPGQRLMIEGAGFPPGRVGTLRLRGTLYRPGREARPIDASLEARAVTPERIEVPVSEAALRRLGGRGTFRGSIEVAFSSAALVGDVFGTLGGIVLDLVPEDAGVASRVPWLVPRIGLAIGAPGDPDGGAIVTAVAEGSRAAQAGILTGDRIVEVGGVRVLGPADIDEPSDREEIAFVVQRGGAFRPFQVRVDLRGLDERIPDSTLRLLQLAALGWLVVLLLVSPAAAWIDRAVGASHPGVPWGFAIAAAAIAIGVRLGLDALPNVGILGTTLAIASGRLAVMVLAVAGVRRRLAAIARGGAGMLAVTAAALAATLLPGSSDVVLIERAQGPAPWDWIALRGPAGACAAVLAVLAASCGPERPSARIRAIDDVCVAAIGACAAIALAGGAFTAGALEGTGAPLVVLGWTLFALTSAGFAILGSRARDRGSRAGTVSLVLGVLLGAVLVSALGVGWAELEVPCELERAIGEVLVVLAAVLTLRMATARPPGPVRPLHAML